VRLENSFEVAAPVNAAWRLLNDVPSVVPCMPGAELVEVVDERSWRAKLHVKLGPIALQFTTDISREAVDEKAGRVVLAVKARETRGRGSAQATIESTLAAANGGTRVDIVTEVILQGAVAQYGRGIVADVASRLTAQFAECIAAKLTDPARLAGSRRTPLGGLRLFLGALWRALLRRPTSGR
jgi:carbon monoxide dehydrogenase subunit G